MEPDDVHDRVPRRDQCHVDFERLEHGDELGGTLRGASFALQHERTRAGLDGSEVAMQQLLGLERLGGNPRASRSLSAASCAVGQSRPAPAISTRPGSPGSGGSASAASTADGSQAMSRPCSASIAATAQV